MFVLILLDLDDSSFMIELFVCLIVNFIAALNVLVRIASNHQVVVINILLNHVLVDLSYFVKAERRSHITFFWNGIVIFGVIQLDQSKTEIKAASNSLLQIFCVKVWVSIELDHLKLG